MLSLMWNDSSLQRVIDRVACWRNGLIRKHSRGEHCPTRGLFPSPPRKASEKEQRWHHSMRCWSTSLVSDTRAASATP